MKNIESEQLTQVQIDNESYFQISNVDMMRPFFMSILSFANHWMFIGSNGGLSAGRKDAEHALFPYYTDDKIIESTETTGSKTILRIQKDNKLYLWEPFSIRSENLYTLKRNLYKSIRGNKILFEEINTDLDISFQYKWSTSDRYGFVRNSKLINHGKSALNISLIDGIQNILPYGVGSSLQKQSSNLVDAYKRNELDKNSGIGIFALSAIIVDKPEPSEALKSTIAWSVGLNNAKRLLSSTQLETFRKGLPVKQEEDVKAEKGAYFIQTEILLGPEAKNEWIIVADINKNVSQIITIGNAIKHDQNLEVSINKDIESGTQQLIQLNAGADGLQLTSDELRDARHFFNGMFNIMRGGIFDLNYQIERNDFYTYLAKVNREIFDKHQETIKNLPQEFSLSVLKEFAKKSDDKNLKRLSLEYLPLKFSRRHGDPSRPWNQFSINTKNENDGSKVLDYAGNWRDIFQNWEALAHSYPDFIDGMILKFLNATTFDGYNPYRITKNGIDWERIEQDDPWSFIGYWGDHQIIYLLKFLEFSQNHVPGKLETYFQEDLFVYANVPYKIKPYDEILKNPKDTIDFDHKLDQVIQDRWPTLGADSALLVNNKGVIHHVNFIEKILATVLAKISNFIPEGGIWMNTQRPEWNDANNALVGNGVSMVTLYYLRRFFTFLEGVLKKCSLEEVTVSEELANFFEEVRSTLLKHQYLLTGKITDKNRKEILDGLGHAASHYRLKIYNQSFSDQRKALPLKDIIKFSGLCLTYLEHTIRANKRSDKLYHAYNLMTIEKDGGISLSYLNEMLEGQVAVLSSGYLTPNEVLETLDNLKRSSLFRKDQYSYLLYPNKELPGFLHKNNIATEDVNKSTVLTSLNKSKNTAIVEQDSNGDFHFHSSFKNASDLNKALRELEKSGNSFSISEKEQILNLFEKVFNHKAFTGRSGTFFGYEGLGSIYWHMVSKLQLAVQECCLMAIEEKVDVLTVNKLVEHYYEINEGIGVHKSPSLYGAFPTDPYSHTPANKGAQQPGMTGQVKEDILSRFGELGVRVKDGQLSFDPCMLKKSEFLARKKSFHYFDVQGNENELPMTEKSLGFTYCQVPIVYKLSDKSELEIVMNNGTVSKNENLNLDVLTSEKIFKRTGEVKHLIASISSALLR